jgi:hypothetical protein
MTQHDFNKHAARLVKHFGDKKWTTERLATLWRHIGDMDDLWFARQIDRVILEDDARFSFAEAARAEKASAWSKKNTQKQIVSQPEPERAGETLEQMLKRLGVSSIKDAYRKTLNNNEPDGAA